MCINPFVRTHFQALVFSRVEKPTTEVVMNRVLSDISASKVESPDIVSLSLALALSLHVQMHEYDEKLPDYGWMYLSPKARREKTPN